MIGGFEMAIYHCSVKIIGRNAGRSSVAAAAYRSAECITNQYDGVEHDFTKKNWVEYTAIQLSKNAPLEYKNRSTLWNAVEMAEKSQDAQLAREFEVALPIELTKEQQIEVVEKFVKENLTSQGMIADIAIHNPPLTNDRHQPIDKDGNVTKDKSKMQFINPHAHILCTVRPIDINGKWEKKSEVEYICKRNGEEKGLTAEEYKSAKNDGWEKQYRYYVGKKKVYYTPSEAQGKNLERVNRTPKTTPYGRKNKTVEYWNDKDRIFEWRNNWERTVNEAFKNINSDIRIDSRSYKDQGRIDEVPTIHMGISAMNMEKRAEREIREGKSVNIVTHSDIGLINKQIKAHNKFVRSLKSKLKELKKTSRGYIDNVAVKLETLRAKLIGNRYEETTLTRRFSYMESELASEKDVLDKLSEEMNKISEANRKSAQEINKLNAELKACSSFHIKRKYELQNMIREEQEKIENRTEYIQGITQRYGMVSDNDYKMEEKEYQKKIDALGKLGNTIHTIKEDIRKNQAEYESTLSSLSKDIVQTVKKRCTGERTRAEKVVKDRLIDRYGDRYNPELFNTSKQIVDESISTAKVVNEIINADEREQRKSYHY